jgi:hypothetical protein
MLYRFESGIQPYLHFEEFVGGWKASEPTC